MIVKEIQVPAKWKSTNDWDSHRELLWLACEKCLTNNGTITEFGCGEGSTKLLYDATRYTLGYFFSYETNEEYATKYIRYVTKVRDYMEVHLSPSPFQQEILFIDCAPGEIRKDLIKKHENNSLVIIAHDSEESAQYVYGMSEILSTFKYRLDYQPEGKPHSVAVSNFIDVTKWITQD